MCTILLGSGNIICFYLYNVSVSFHIANNFHHLIRNKLDTLLMITNIQPEVFVL